MYNAPVHCALCKEELRYKGSSTIQVPLLRPLVEEHFYSSLDFRKVCSRRNKFPLKKEWVKIGLFFQVYQPALRTNSLTGTT